MDIPQLVALAHGGALISSSICLAVLVTGFLSPISSGASSGNDTRTEPWIALAPFCRLLAFTCLVAALGFSLLELGSLLWRAHLPGRAGPDPRYVAIWIARLALLIGA